VLSWLDGVQGLETGYVVARIDLATGGVTILPAGPPLPGDATGFTDAAPPAGLQCYVPVALGAGGVLGNGDLLCEQALASGAQAEPFWLELNESKLASLVWRGPGTQDSFTLVVIRPGLAPLSIPLPGTATSYEYDTGGAPAGFLLMPRLAGANLGQSDLLFGVPGIATLSTSAGESVEGVSERARAAVEAAVRRAGGRDALVRAVEQAKP
jgi:hypothetical protein